MLSTWFFCQVQVFIARLNGESIGLSAWGLFVLDLSAILTVCLSIIFFKSSNTTVFLLDSVAVAAARADDVDNGCDAMFSDNRCLSWLCHCHSSIQLARCRLYV